VSCADIYPNETQEIRESSYTVNTCQTMNCVAELSSSCSLVLTRHFASRMVSQLPWLVAKITCKTLMSSYLWFQPRYLALTSLCHVFSANGSKLRRSGRQETSMVGPSVQFTAD